MQKIEEKYIERTSDGFAWTLRRAYRAAYGFGEKFDSVDQKGKLVRALVREKCFYQGEYTYLSMPFFLTPDGFGVYVDTRVEVDFDFRVDGEIGISFAEGSNGERAEIYLFEGTPKEIMNEFRSMAGYPRLFPKWVLGAWMSANRWKTQAEVEKQVEISQRLGFPHSVIVVEPWSDLSTHYLWNGSLCPEKNGDEFSSYSEMDFSKSSYWQDPKEMVEKLHGEGLKLLLWVIPIYAQGASIETDWNVAQRLKDNEYVKEHGECVRNADGTPYEIPHTWCVGSMVPDFTNPSAREHWFNHFKHLKEIGVDGFKTDGGEFIHDRTVRFSDGTTGKEGQNAYCEQYTRAFAEFVGEEGIVFSRAGGQGTPAYSVVWAGDQESTWSEFASVIKAGLSAGISGVGCWGFDISGFSGYLPSAELYLRAVQAAAFLPVMQWHSDPVSNKRCDFTGAWTINDRSPWNIAAYHKDKKLLGLMREQFFLHYNLLPYLYALMKEAHETGVSPMRHLVTEFPGDEKVFSVEDEFMLGDALLVAPVLQDYIDAREVYLPEGDWFELFTGKKAAGGKHRAALRRRYTPVYMRNNRCVPLNLSGGKLCSDVGSGMDGYRELTFLVSGRGRYAFSDDLGNNISLEWNENSHRVLQNEKSLDFQVIHIEGKTLL